VPADHYLKLISFGGSGMGQGLGAFNYDTTRLGRRLPVGGIIDFNRSACAPTTNTTNPLQIRVVLFLDLLTRWTSITPFSLSADGAWHHAVFAIGALI